MSITTQVPIVVDGVQYVTAPEDTIPDGVRTGAIVQAQLIDELTNAPVAGPITVTPAGTAFDKPRARAAVNPRSVDGGIVGLVGIPVKALPLIGGTSYDVGLSAAVSGFVTMTVTKSHGPFLQFPQAFAPADLGGMMLHREPVMLFGRANLRTATDFKPLHNVIIRVSGVWRTLPTLTSSPAASPPDLAAVDPVLYAARLTGASVNVVTLAPDGPHEKKLLRPAPAGATQVYLSDRVNLVATNVLGIDETDPSRAEWIVVKSIVGSTSDSEPAVATLEFPVARSHGAGALAHPTAVGAPSGTQGLSFDAIAGDTTLLLGGVGGLATATVEIAGGGPAANEYHMLSLYTASSDVDGQWRLPPLSREAQVILEATHAPDTCPPRTVTIEYPRREQRIDLVFT